MKTKRNFTAIIEKDDNMYVALCPELDIASQGNSVEEARNNLKQLNYFWKKLLPQKFKKDYTLSYLLLSLKLLGKLKILSGKDVCKILKQNVFIEIRQKGRSYNDAKTI